MTKKKNKDDIVYSKEEMNLVEYPIQYLSKTIPENVKTVEWSGEKVMRDGTKKTAFWVVTGSDKYGLPRYHDRDVLLVLMYFWKEKDFVSNELFIKVSDMLSLLKWDRCNTRYNDLKESLDRLSGVTIIAENCFWDNSIKDFVRHITFHIIDAVNFTKEGRSNILYVRFGKEFWQSVKNGYIKSLNFKFYISLPDPTSKTLYSFLDKKAYHSNQFTIDVLNLAKHIGLKTDQPIRFIRRKIIEASEVLVLRGFLTFFEIKKDIITFYFNEGFKTQEVKAQGDNTQVDNDAFAKYLLEEISLLLGERNSFIEQVVRRLPSELIFRVLGEVKEKVNNGELTGTKMQEFERLIRKYSYELYGVVLEG